MRAKWTIIIRVEEWIVKLLLIFIITKEIRLAHNVILLGCLCRFFSTLPHLLIVWQHALHASRSAHRNQARRQRIGNWRDCIRHRVDCAQLISFTDCSRNSLCLRVGRNCEWLTGLNRLSWLGRASTRAFWLPTIDAGTGPRISQLTWAWERDWLWDLSDRRNIWGRLTSGWV